MSVSAIFICLFVGWLVFWVGLGCALGLGLCVELGWVDLVVSLIRSFILLCNKHILTVIST